MSRKILVASGFVAVLVALGVADAALTGGTFVLPGRGAGVAKHGEFDPVAVAEARGFAVAETDEPTILARTDEGADVNERALLLQNDRAATMAWTDSADVKSLFTGLRKELRDSFSPGMRDLIDETQSEPDRPPRDVLAFLDPGLHPDRLVFVRIRQRLYEFHVSPGKEQDIDGLVDALTE